MDPKSRLKALETKRQRAAAFADKTIEVGDDWRIVRADELNWEVQFQGKFKGYYGSPVSALQSLPAKMLGEATNRQIAVTLANQNRICEEIRKTVSMLTAADLV